MARRSGPVVFLAVFETDRACREWSRVGGQPSRRAAAEMVGEWGLVAVVALSLAAGVMSIFFFWRWMDLEMVALLRTRC